ncbi:MAG: RidA family protein [Capsulimonadales bacterium]|nr:RidA family protein [Capsulimonadales bacterium]
MSDEKKPALPLSMFRRIGTTVYIAGHGVPTAGDTLEAQMRATMEQFAQTLAAAGVTHADIVMVRGYVQNAADLPTYNRLYREFFSEPYPARTTIVNCLPPGLLFEIDAVAEGK